MAPSRPSFSMTLKPWPLQSGQLLISDRSGLGLRKDSTRASASPVRWIVVAKPPGLVIPWPDFWRWFAYRRHSSRVNLDATPTHACVCVFSSWVVTSLYSILRADSAGLAVLAWLAEIARLAVFARAGAGVTQYSIPCSFPFPVIAAPFRMRPLLSNKLTASAVLLGLRFERRASFGRLIKQLGHPLPHANLYSWI